MGGAALDADAWARLSAAQQAFVAESGGLTAAAAHAIGRLADAARSGPGGLFTWLLKQTDLPRAELRSACFNLLPQLPDRLGQFEKSFGTLGAPERMRLRALTAEAGGQWHAAERAWQALAEHYRDIDDRTGRMAAGVICRSLARLCREHPEMDATGTRDPQIWYLERSREVDPDHLPTVLTLLAHYRSEAEDAKWHALTDEAVTRFGDDSQILRAAMDSAVAREAYKKATGFARRLLKIDPINLPVRRQMIELHVAHARKQMRGKRPDLAARELALAADWDRPDAPSAVLRMARGLVSLRNGERETAMALLQEAAALAGGGVAARFRIVLEAELMKCSQPETAQLRRELAQARATPPTRPEVLAVATALGQPEAVRNKRALAAVLVGMRSWLEQGAAIAWTQDEFMIVADSFTRFEAYDLLHAYAAAARRREPSNPEWRFQEIVGRTRGNYRFMTDAERDAIDDLVDAAMERRDFHARSRLMRFLDVDEAGPARHGPARHGPARHGPARHGRDDDDILDALGELDPEELYNDILNEMPKGFLDGLRDMIRSLGREAGIELTMAHLGATLLDGVMPVPLLRSLAEQMVDMARAGTAGRRRCA